MTKLQLAWLKITEIYNLYAKALKREKRKNDKTKD